MKILSNPPAKSAVLSVLSVAIAIFSHQPTVNSQQYSAIGNRQSAIGSSGNFEQLPITSYQLPVTSYQLPVTSYQLPVTSYQLPVTSYQLPVTSYQLPVTSYQLPITSYQLPVTSYQQPTTNNQQPTTNNQQPIAQFPNSPPPISPLSPNAPYTLGVGDSIQVDIFEVPEYTGEYKVLIDGTVNLPIIGRVLVEGLDLNAVSDRLEQQYARYIVDPIITVSLVTARPIDLVVSGEVNRPGAYNVEIDGGSEYPTITEAIELAQGITRSADVEEVEVRRVYQDREQVYKVNLWDVLRGQSFVQDLTLRDGDIVNIPTLTVVDLDNIRQLADSSLAPEVIEPFDVAVVGEVLRPGTYAVNQGGGDTNTSGNNNLPTLTAAVQLAGGITPKADIRNVTLRRQTRRGEEQLIDIDLWQLLKEGDLSQDAILQPGDTIIIPEATAVLPEELPSLTAASFAPNSIRVSIAGEVGDAGVYELPASTTLNQAILSAGGFNPRARRATVELIRLNNDSTVTRQTIPVDFAAGINDDQNPLLLNNDVIVVNRSFIAESSDFLNLLLGPVTSFFTLLNSPLNFLNIFQQN